MGTAILPPLPESPSGKNARPLAAISSGRIWLRWTRRELKKHWFYWLCQTATLFVAVYWVPYLHLPLPGKAIAILAGLAALMSVHANMRPRHKFVYLALMALLLGIEFRAMRKDRDEAAIAQRHAQTEEDARLQGMLDSEKQATKTLIDDENKKFGSVLRQDQKEFTKTLTVILGSHERDESHFANVVDREESLLAEQKNLSEQIVGRLVPGNDPTPANPCMVAAARPELGRFGEITTIVGDNAIVGPSTPHAILQVGNTSVIGLERVPDSDAVSLSIDFRDDHNRVLLRMDENGVVNRSPLILMHPVKNEFLIENQYGDEFMKVIYINPTTFKVTGSAIYCGKIIPVLLPFASRSCMASMGAGVDITLPTCQSH